MSDQIAHDVGGKWRSDDVIVAEEKDFSSFNLDERILAGLVKEGYKIPSRIQLEAIPLCLTGSDVFVQGKIGTGKTLLFCILALNVVLEVLEDLQVLIVASTCEGAFEIYNTITTIGSEVKSLKCEFFIGGFPYTDDVSKARECNIAVGTPGRICHLITEDHLKVDSIRLFVIDDVDQFLDERLRYVVNVFSCTLPVKRQTIVTSLVRSKEVMELASEHLKSPYLTSYCEEESPSLLGMTHYYYNFPVGYLNALGYRKKLETLKYVLLTVKYSQCIIFCNSIYRVELVHADIKKCGLPITTITKSMGQVDRLQALDSLKRNKCKVLISTDVTSKGVDAENVDLVINFDMPSNSGQYLHRCGRAGRNGAKCSTITFVLERQMNVLTKIVNEEYLKIHVLPEPVPEDLIYGVNISKLSNLGCDSEKSNVLSLVRLSRNAIIKLEKSKGEEGYGIISSSKINELTANLEIVDSNHLLPVFETNQPEKEVTKCYEDSREITAKKTGLLLSVEENSELPGKNFHDSEDFKKDDGQIYRDEVAVKSANKSTSSPSDLEFFSNKNKMAQSNKKHRSKGLTSMYKPLSLRGGHENLIVSSDEGESKIKNKQQLKIIHSRAEGTSPKDFFSASTSIPKSMFKMKSSKNVEPEAFDQGYLEREGNLKKKVTRIPQTTQEKKNHKKNIGDRCCKKSSSLAKSGYSTELHHVSDHCNGQIEFCERQVKFCNLKTEGNNNSCMKSCSAFLPNHPDDKTVCTKCHMHSKCGKCLNESNNSQAPYFNASRNYFPGTQMFVNAQCNCCKFRSCCHPFQHSSYPKYYF